jgi:hypothetical protein
MMKRLLFLFLVVFLLSGCGKQEPAQEITEPTVEVTEPVSIYMPDSSVEQQTGGAVTVYVPEKDNYIGMGVMGEEAKTAAEKGFEAVLREFITIEEDKLTMSGICVGTGVMKYAGYAKRPTSQNDLHGMGAFLLMCAEIAKM